MATGQSEGRVTQNADGLFRFLRQVGGLDRAPDADAVGLAILVQGFVEQGDVAQSRVDQVEQGRTAPSCARAGSPGSPADRICVRSSRHLASTDVRIVAVPGAWRGVPRERSPPDDLQTERFGWRPSSLVSLRGCVFRHAIRRAGSTRTFAAEPAGCRSWHR